MILIVSRTISSTDLLKGGVLLLTSASFKDVNRKAFNNKYLNANFSDKDSPTPKVIFYPNVSS